MSGSPEPPPPTDPEDPRDREELGDFAPEDLPFAPEPGALRRWGGGVPMPPPMPNQLADLAERRTWALDAFDTITDAQRAEAKVRGDVGRFGEIYIVFLALVLVAAMGFSGMRGVFTPTCAACTPTLRSMLGLGISAAAIGGVLLLAGLLGPLGLGRARRVFLGESPADRAVVVRGPLGAIVLGCAVAGALCGGAAALAGFGSGAEVAGLVVSCAVTGGLLGANLVLAAAVLQSRRNASALVVRCGGALLGCGSLLLFAAVNPSSTALFPTGSAHMVGAFAQLLPPLLLAAALLGAASALLLARRVADSARRVPAAELARGGEVAEALISSTLMLDISASSALAERRSLARRGWFRSRRMGGRGAWALMRTDLRRLARRPLPLLVAMAWVPIPAVVASLLGPKVASVVALLLAVGIGNTLSSGLRTWTRAAALQRGLPLTPMAARLALLLAPALVVSVWTALAFGLAGLDSQVWSVLTLACYAAILRCAKPSEMATAAASVAVTPMGAMPVGVVAALVRGPDIAAIPVALALLGEPTSGLLAAAMFLWFQLVAGSRQR
ncbi:DUF6297 family protein [Gephyromycinifex aptenodytis]|uniref:DUF6297 family protein n=1 Tax=Gephyromycinifex aptenodytis TaxID=2716227 RepID=UPI001447B146|nr:DUF6297 family protein [Gephyromycinifex aptenodytis]